MIAAWMLWSIGVGVLLLVAGLAVERLLDGSRRWVWATAGAGTLVLTAIRAFSGGGAGTQSASAGHPVVESLGASGPGAAGGALAEAPFGYLPFMIPPDSVLHMFDGVLLLVWLILSVGLAVSALIGAGDFLHRRRFWEPGRLLGQRVLWSRDTGPAVVGLFRPRVVVPSWVHEVEPSEQKLILAHEEEHRGAGDAVLRVALATLLIAFPWNPVLWLHYRRLCLAIELDCDDRVMQRLPHRRWHYGDLLFRVGSRGGVRRGFALAAFAEQPSFLERRIRRLLSKAPEVGMAQVAFLAFAAILVVGVAMWVPGVSKEADPVPLTNSLVTNYRVNIRPIPEAEKTDLPQEGVTEHEVIILPYNDPRLAELPLPPGIEAIELEATADAEGVASRPQFVVYTVKPNLLNGEEVDAVLQREYPALLKDAGVGGTTLVHVFIDTGGRVRNQLVRTTSGHKALDLAALEVVKVARFSPAQNRDTPVAIWIELPITFTAN